MMHFSPVDLGDQQGDVISRPQQGRDDVAFADVAGPETSDVNDSNSPRQCIEAPEHGSGVNSSEKPIHTAVMVDCR